MAQVIENQVIKLEHIVYSQLKEVELLAKKAINKAKKFGIAEREAEIAAGKLSSHYGEVKKRYKGIEVVCTMKIFRDNDWGGSYIQKLKVGNDILVYFGNALEELKKDEKAIIDFTVKEHGEFRGELNTKINRPKIVK